MKTVIRWLEQHRAEAVAQIIERVCEQLPDYRQRPMDQLTATAGAAYDQWCATVLENDLLRHAREAEAVIAQNVAQGTNPSQLSRIPALICAVVVSMLAQAGPEVDPAERALFQEQAEHMTATILGLGGLRIAQAVLKKAVKESVLPPPRPRRRPEESG